MTELATTAKEKTEGLLDRPLATLLTLDWEKILYATFILLALVTRLWGLGARVMSHDESLHTQFSLQFFRGDGYNHTPLMHGPFLFHVTPLFYWLFGVSDFSARLPVALFGVVLVAMPYLLRGWLGKTGALFTSFFFLISPYITYYSRYIRHDIYVIVWALILFIATWHYLRQRKEKYLWWFAAGLALMYATKEVSFIYTAIFGSFLALRLLVRTWPKSWLQEALPRLRRPLLLLLVGLVVLGAGFGGLRLTAGAPEEATATTTPAEEQQGFAADPGEEATAAPTTAGSTEQILRWLQVAGLLLFAGAIFLVARELRPHLEEYGEFDLIVLFSTLILPAVSPFLVVLAGFDPTDYSVNLCELAGQAQMSRLELLLARATNSTCVSAFLSSPAVRTGFFVVLTLVLAAIVGIWWNRRRWIIAAALFHGIFFLLYTSVFTNPGGWASGMVGSLGYWLEQQEVQRGSQPWFYYFFVVPFYEFLPLIFSLLAIRLWSQRRRLNRIFSYWIPLLLVTLLVYSFSNWLANRPAVLAGGQSSNLLALVLAASAFTAGVLYWYLVFQNRVRAGYDLGRSWRGLVDPESLVQFIPMVIWWLLCTWVLYSVAGEKMPWLSTHFVIPMALLSGWYFNEKLSAVEARELLSRRGLTTMALVIVFIGAAFLALKPLLLGQLQLGNQQLDNLTAIGRFVGSVALAGVAYTLLRMAARRVAPPIRRRSWLLGAFAVLSLLTARFTYMSSGPNADYATEFMVYAHAAPAVKDVVLPQVETLSQRLHGDKSMKVAWGDDGTWPMQWYLRDYPNRLYAGQNPSANITDYPVVVTGHRDLEAYENFLNDREYEKHDYTFLWWPMEDYRHIGWNALFGLSNVADEQGSTATGRGLQNPDVRQALWDIFFYRDYDKYSDVFDKTHTVGQWPLRADLRLYIRRDVLAELWDYGAGAARIEPPVDPYAGGQLQLTPNLVIGAGGTGEGQLSRPRNLAPGPQGNVYVLDSNNHRVAVFDAEGQLVRAWGNQGTAAGQFNEPWGIAVDDNFVYVADTWNHRVQKFTLEGEFVTSFGQSGTTGELGQDSGGYFFGPRSLTLLPEDRILVTDTGNHRLQLFNRDGTFIRTLGQTGSDPGQFNEPVGLAGSPQGYLYLADTWNARIQRFTPELAPDLNWSIDGWEGESTENKPYLAVDSEGRVYATDPENFRILIFSADGQYLARFGQPGASIDELGLPNGIAIDAQDNVYVADAHNDRVLRFPAIDFSSLPPESETQGEPAGDEPPTIEEEGSPDDQGAGEDMPQPSPTEN
jgi:predicted membrane-bound mannosyltransferase/DNA-binding beta-propeller fold protein YncE